MSGFQGYDQWKTTEPESDYDPPEPNIEEHFVEHITYLEGRIGHYRAALHKIAGWKGYEPHEDHWRDKYVVDQYERGGNDMLATLKQIAEEALG